MSGSTSSDHPLSFQQQTELDEYNSHPEYATGACWVYLFRLHRAADLSSLRAGLRALVRRHASLRTVVRPSGAVGVQRVGDPDTEEPLAVQSFDSLEGLVEHVSARRPGVAEIWRGEALFQPRVFAVGRSLYLGITIQHLIFDGLSLPVFMRELTELYSAFATGRPPALGVAPSAYTDFTLTQRALWQENRSSAVSFWSSVLSGYSGLIDWPAPDRSSVDPAAGTEYYEFQLSPEGAAVVRRTARASRVSPFMVLLAASGIAITRTFRQSDVVIGTDYANRPGESFKETLGFFANTRFTRFDGRRHGSLAEAVQGVAVAWSSVDPRTLPPYGPLQQAIGGFDFVKVGMEIPVRRGASLPLAGAISEEVPIPMSNPYWRKLKLQWFNTPAGYSLSIKLQPTEVARQVPPEIMAHLAHVLGAGRPAPCP